MPAQEWIRAILKERGFKLKDAAAALNVSPPRMTDILKGRREVQADEILPLARLLGLSSKSLLRSIEKGRFEMAGPDDSKPGLPVLGLLTCTGDIKPLLPDSRIREVPTPPDAEIADGLYCYIMGDDSMEQEIRKGSIIIAGDPRLHYCPMVPGAILLVRRGQDGLTARQYYKDDNSENWLIPLPDKYSPQFKSWRFSLLPKELDDAVSNIKAPDAGTENDDHDIVRTTDIVAVVMWVHRRHTPAKPA